MKLASWNVNSLRARLDRVLAWLAAQAPDVLLLQETKVTDAEFPAEPLQAAGYHALFHGQKTYNGVAVLARTPPLEVARGLGDGGDEAGARVLVADVGEVRVASVYVPNGRAVDTPHFAEKLVWLGRLRQRLAQLSAPGRPLVVGGDWNVTPDDRDVYDPEGLRDTIHCHPAERAALSELLASGLVDTFRLHHADAGHYSWWDYRQLGFPKNRGLRLDLLLCSRELSSRCAAAGIDREARKGQGASDHTPIWMELT